MPTEIENYVHRIGRTGRAGKTGVATTFINKSVDEATLLDLKGLLREARQRIPPVLEMLEDPRDLIKGDKTAGGCSFCGGLGHSIVRNPTISELVFFFFWSCRNYFVTNLTFFYFDVRNSSIVPRSKKMPRKSTEDSTMPCKWAEAIGKANHTGLCNVTDIKYLSVSLYSFSLMS